MTTRIGVPSVRQPGVLRAKYGDPGWIVEVEVMAPTGSVSSSWWQLIAWTPTREAAEAAARLASM